MMNLTLAAGIVLGAIAAAPPTDLPEELQGLTALMEDEDRLVDAVRGFDKFQLALAAWDLDLADNARFTGDTETYQRHMESARHRRALVQRAYQEVLARYPENARALTYSGELLYDHFGDQAGAIRAWKLAAAFDDQLTAPRNNLALHYCHVGDYDLGLAYMEEAIELDPDHPDYAFNLAQIYLVHFPQVQERYDWSRKRVYREAMKLSRHAAELRPADYALLADYAVNFFAAENFGVRADWTKAAAAWRRARSQARDEGEEFYTWLNEARAWMNKPDTHQAALCLREALAMRPDNDVARRLLHKVEGAAAAPSGPQSQTDKER